MRRVNSKRQVKNRVPPANEERSAFTLVEMLIASILVATLMATVWSLTSLYSGFLIAGRAQAEEQQLARSLIEIISADLHAIIPDRAGDSTLDATHPLPSTDPLVMDRPDELATSALGRSDPFGLSTQGQFLPTFDIRGRAHELTLSVADVEPQIELLPLDDDTGEPLEAQAIPVDQNIDASGTTELPGLPRAPEYRRIVYLFVPPRIVDAADAEERQPGLYRYEIPVEHLGLLTLSDELVEPNTPGDEVNVADVIRRLTEQGLTSVKEEWVPEIVGCDFEYLTEQGWESSWASVDDGRRLKAIRVRLRLLSPEEHAELMLALGAAPESERADNVNAAIDRELNDEFDAEQNPFAAFQPRTFERIILMSTPGRLALGEEGQSTNGVAAGTFAGSTFGGQP